MTRRTLALLCSVVGISGAARKQIGTHESSTNSSVGPLDIRRVICPVLAALIKTGKLAVDEAGDTELADIRDTLRYKLGSHKNHATFEAHGIAVFDREHKESQDVRNRCLGLCMTARFVWNSNNEKNLRWFSPFRMNGRQAMEHGISTGVRGGATNMPFDNGCGGEYPCQKMFDKFVAPSVGPNNRFYMTDIFQIVCKARQYGDRGGEWSYKSFGKIDFLHLAQFDLGPVPARDWQMKAATTSMLFVFGKTDSNGDTYMDYEDVRALYMDAKLPDYWKEEARDLQCIFPGGCDMPVLTRMRWDMDRDTGCVMKEDDPWWAGQDCPAHTTERCTKTCDGGAICVEGQCMCPRGATGHAMCASGTQCVPSTLPACTYFGEPCEFFTANNPSTDGNPQ